MAAKKKFLVWVKHNYAEKMRAYGCELTFDRRSFAADPAGFKPQRATLVIDAPRKRRKGK